MVFRSSTPFSRSEHSTLIVDNGYSHERAERVEWLSESVRTQTVLIAFESYSAATRGQS